MNFKTGDLIAEKIEFPTNEKIITTPMWLKLLATKMVASNFFGRCNNFEIKLAFEASSSNNVAMSFCVSEKRATSAAETIAEQKRKNAIDKLPKTKFVSMALKKLKLGSGSK